VSLFGKSALCSSRTKQYDPASVGDVNMPLQVSLTGRAALACACLCGCRALAAEPAVECLYLDGLSSPKRWETAECELAVSSHTAWEHPALRLRIPVDFASGEKLYPIGWPRMYLNLKPDEQAWQAYDRFEFQLFTESSRTNLPKRPLTFHAYGPSDQKKLLPLEQATLGATITFAANISDLGLTGRVMRIGFNINESDYADKDLVDFHLGGFRLVRATVAQITELKAVAPALFRDSRVLPVELVAEGPPDKLAAGVPFQLRLGERTVLAQTMPVVRGRQTLYVPLAGVALTPGALTLAVYPDDSALRKEASVVITSSPWQP
jgi:hypothetical protein